MPIHYWPLCSVNQFNMQKMFLQIFENLKSPTGVYDTYCMLHIIFLCVEITIANDI